MVILGPGRSGTSLCAKILGHLGINIEDSLRRANEMNPEGYFEDATLVGINKRLVAKLVPVPGLGPLENYDQSLISPEVKELRTHLAERTTNRSQMWGFKDPRVSLLLPIYRRAFQSVGIVPTYVFCARRPELVVESLHQADNVSRDTAEQIYFVRSFLALRDCSANAHIVHYERLLADPEGEIDDLWRHVGDQTASCPISEVEKAGLVEPKFNRSELRAVPIRNPMAVRIATLLERMVGSDFDRTAVLSELREIDAIHGVYQACFDRARRGGNTDGVDVSALTKQVKSERAKFDQDLKEASERAARHESVANDLRAELSRLQAENAQLDEERNGAITRARSSEGILADAQKKLREQEDAQKKLREREDAQKKLREQEDAQKKLREQEHEAERPQKKKGPSNNVKGHQEIAAKEPKKVRERKLVRLKRKASRLIGMMDRAE